MDRYSISEYDLLKLISEELMIRGSDWSTKEKVDYIYIRMCQLFNFDERWAYTSNNDLCARIFEKKFDITKIDSKKTVCNGFSHAFCDVLSWLPELFEDIEDIELLGNLGHVYSMVQFRNEGIFYYDPIGQTNDFLNIKKKFPIEGIIFSGPYSYETDLYQENSFRKIGYKAEGLKELKDISGKLQGDFYSAEDYFDKLVELSNFDGLGMYEVNNLLNLQTKDALMCNLPDCDIKLNKYEDKDNVISFLYDVGEDAVYKEDEADDGVKIYRIK